MTRLGGVAVLLLTINIWLALGVAWAASDYNVASNSDSSCTKGRLFLSEQLTGTVRAYSLDNGFGLLSTFTSTTQANTNMYTIETGHAVAAVTKGTTAMNFTDGLVRFFTSGLDGITASTPAQHSFQISCTSPVHFTSSHGYGWNAVFCDGWYSVNDAYHINATAYYLNEAHLYNTGSTVDYFSWKMPSAHHGVAWALDEDHFLYSVATAARESRNSTDSLPNGFVIAFRNGTQVHDISDHTDTHTSCHGFHGESHVHERFAFGCDSAIDNTHDGILMLEKDEHTETYTSKKMAYPDNIGTARTSTIQSNEHVEYFIGNFGSHLLAWTGAETTLVGTSLSLNMTGFCAWNVDKSRDGFVFWLGNNGILNIYKIVNGVFVRQPSVTVFTTSILCTNVAFVPGWGIVGVLRRDVPSLSYVNLAGATVTNYPLSYVPQSGTIVAEEEHLCRACDACLNGHGDAVSGSMLSHQAMPIVVLASLIMVSSLLLRQ